MVTLSAVADEPAVVIWQVLGGRRRVAEVKVRAATKTAMMHLNRSS